MAAGEKCCNLTDPFLKSSAASASRTARQDREEYEQEEDEKVDMDNWVTGGHVFIMDTSDDLLICFMHCGCALFRCSCV